LEAALLASTTCDASFCVIIIIIIVIVVIVVVVVVVDSLIDHGSVNC
jgi:hypothetical protein